jgi:hypothetical protein
MFKMMMNIYYSYFHVAVTVCLSVNMSLGLFIWHCYICEVPLVVALALLQQCNSTTLLWRFLRYTAMLDGFGVIGE